MNVYKNGICRKIDKSREKEFKDKGYIIEGQKGLSIDMLKSQNDMLKSENEALKKQLESLLNQQSETIKTGGDDNGESENNGESRESQESGESQQAKATTRGRK